MTRDELNGVLAKLGLLEGRSFTTAQGDAWYEILGARKADDAHTAVLQFHSKPFKRVAYPGDINGIVEDIERSRLALIGSLEPNLADLESTGNRRPLNKELYRVVRQGELSPAGYREYQRSRMTLKAFMAGQAVLTSA
ncbi:hypothetical protein [Arthrobacter sp. 260]|uniref:hypothetical protein n=1 Tax=Arthrobacter sp. 260 TaxID=2735314 RepID=UPI001491607E|nr:hypothetical protein [Arthrobacter sp. 260]NOJ59740.1 hypothetical protein [Arthrobacter sp. 260]